MFEQIEITTRFPEFMQELFDCKEIDRLIVYPHNGNIQRLSLGIQNIFIYGFKVNSNGVYFHFLDPAGCLLHYHCGTIDKVLNNNIQKSLMDII